MDSEAVVDKFFDSVFSGGEYEGDEEAEASPRPPPKSQPRPQARSAPTAPPEPVQDKVLADLDTRLAIADYYRAVLDHEFWELDNAVAKAVHAEVSTFVRNRLQELLGVKATPAQAPKSQFQDEEVSVLRALAKKMLGGILSKPTQEAGSEPVSESSPAPATRPRPKPKTSPTFPPRPEPKLKSVRRAQTKVQEPEVEDSQTDEAGDFPIPKNLRTSLQPSQAEIEAARKQGTLVQQFREGKNTYTYIEGRVFEEGGRKYVIKRNNNGFLYRHSISGQVLPADYAPPDTETLAAISAASARAVVEAQQRTSSQVLQGKEAAASPTGQDTVSVVSDSSSNFV